MSFFGFNASNRHNMAAPGFSQPQDPFAGLSRNDDLGEEALDFEDTYDGLGNQLDETDDAFNDDTFGGETTDIGLVGNDFDFFGQTAKVADAIEEEHLWFNRQIPAHKSAAAVGWSSNLPAHEPPGLIESQSAPRPARTGYEKYRENEPIPDLHVDQSIWGISSSKAPATATAQHQQPLQAGPSSSGRRVLSLEEVEAAMRAQPKKLITPQLLIQERESQSAFSESYSVHVPQSREPHQQRQQLSQYGQQQQQQKQQHQSQPSPGYNQPVAILKRPQILQSKPQVATEGLPTQPVSRPQHLHPNLPVQILQNPNRMPGDAGRMTMHAHRVSLSHGSVPNIPHGIHGPPQLIPMSEDEKATFLEQEARRAKRNHKIWLLSKDNGLMTPQDKNFITRIQLQQLVSATGNLADQGSDPSISEDFYYQVYSHIRAGQLQNPSQPLSNFAQTYLFQTGTRHGGGRRHGRPAENHIQRMEQQVQRAVEAAKNKPKNPQLVIAGSLGKISFSNSKAPKPLLNIKRTENESQRSSNCKKTPAPENGLDRKRVLRNVEKVYDTLMKMEDHVRFMPPNLSGQADKDREEKHKQWSSLLEYYNAKLWDELKVHEPIGLTVPHPFIAFLSCAKGKKAIPRIFPHLSFEQRTTILTMIIYHLDQLDVVQGASTNNGETSLNSRLRENIELFISTVMPSLMQYLNDTGLDIVDGVLHLIATKLNVDYITRTRIGVSMLTLILSRAVLLKQTGGGNSEQWDKWDQTFEILFSKLELSLVSIFPGSVNAGDVHVWQLLAAMGVSATHDQQTRLVLAVKDRVLDTVVLSKTLPPAMAAERLGSVNLFMRSIGLDVELLQ